MLIALRFHHFYRTLTRITRQIVRMRDNSGVSAVEFALSAPLMLTVLVGMFTFGLALNNYVAVTNAAQSAAFQLAVSRGASTPYTTTLNAAYGAAPNLTKTKLTVTLTVNGSTCSSDTSCSTSLSSAMGKSASVSVSYPCNLQVLQVNYLNNCSLDSSATGRVQ